MLVDVRERTESEFDGVAEVAFETLSTLIPALNSGDGWCGPMEIVHIRSW